MTRLERYVLAYVERFGVVPSRVPEFVETEPSAQ